MHNILIRSSVLIKSGATKRIESFTYIVLTMSTIFNELKLRKLISILRTSINTFFRPLLLFYSANAKNGSTKRHGPSPHHPDHHPGILCFLIFSRKTKK